MLISGGCLNNYGVSGMVILGGKMIKDKLIQHSRNHKTLVGLHLLRRTTLVINLKSHSVHILAAFLTCRTLSVALKTQRHEIPDPQQEEHTLQGI